MKDRVVEWVPNLSEGRDGAVIERVAQAIVGAGGVLLHSDSGFDAHRTVLSVVAPAQAIVEIALAGYRATLAAIDMRHHSGVHPRIGALDVSPFVPLWGVSLSECAELAGSLAERVGDELGLPVFRYGAAAEQDPTRSLAALRRGGYEALERRFRRGLRADHGPSRFVAQSGATIIGARELMVAFNVNLESRDVVVAERIAAAVRTSGAILRDDAGQLRRDARGRPLRQNGRLPAVMAKGWWIAEYGCTQVTMNLLDFRQTSIVDAFEAVREEAQRLGVETRGSELVGLAPLAAFSRSVGAGIDDVSLRAAFERLGLDAVRPFDPKRQLLEERLATVGMAGIAIE